MRRQGVPCHQLNSRVLISSFTKVARMVEEREYATQIKEALDFVNFSKDAVRSNQIKTNQEISNFKKSQLRSKGKLFVNQNAEI